MMILFQLGFLLVFQNAKISTVSALQLHLSAKAASQNVKKPIAIGGIFPQQALNSRFYKVDVFQGHLKELPKSTHFLQHYGLMPDMQQSTVSMSENSYPMDVIQALCGVLVPKRVSSSNFYFL